MKKQNENEELQSRREFFKQAAKKALPVFGAIALASSPIIAKASEMKPMGCNSYCYNSCMVGCSGTCQASCQCSCRHSCQGSCTGGCYNSCMGTYIGGCATQAYA